jgi:hypothetical protein
VSWIHYPNPGDVVAAGYKPGGKDAALILAGDERKGRPLRTAPFEVLRAVDLEVHPAHAAVATGHRRR